MTTAQNDFWSGVENVFVELGLRPAKPTPAKIVSGPCQARGSQGASSGDRRGESEVSSKSWVRFLKCCLQFARARGHCHQLLLQTASPHHKHNHCIQAQKLQEQLGAQPASHVHEESMSNVFVCGSDLRTGLCCFRPCTYCSRFCLSCRITHGRSGTSVHRALLASCGPVSRSAADM